MDSIEELIKPIPGENPSGANLRYSPEYEAIKEARREEADLAQGEWRRERKLADFHLAAKIAQAALRSSSKDLQIAVWLTEAQTRLRGFEGLALGLLLIKELLTRFWDTIYPELEDGDFEMRAMPLEWLGGRTDVLVKSLPLTESGLNYWDYLDGKKAGHEEDSAVNAMRREQFELARREGKTTADDWDRAVAATQRHFFERSTSAVDVCAERLRDLAEVTDERFGNIAPSYRTLEQALDDIRGVCQRALWGKDPALIHAEAAEAAIKDALTTPSIAAGQPTVSTPSEAPKESTAAPKYPWSHAEAVNAILQGAAYLRAENPYSSMPYRLVRVLRWSELGAPGQPLDAAALPPPPTALRQEIRKLAVGKDWSQLLSAVEEAMAMEWGRGWLDLQRHAYRACERLGDDYREIRLAIRAEVRSLLQAYPDLMTAALGDDTPSANFETIAWLRESVLPNGPSGTSAEGKPPSAEEDPLEPAGKILARAAQQAAGGEYHGAIDTLRRAVARQTSPRIRFWLKAHLGSYCLAAGQKAMARSVLQELVDQIDALRLELWESPQELAAIYAGLYQCLEGADGHRLTQETLYSQICRLDPAQVPPR